MYETKKQREAFINHNVKVLGGKYKLTILFPSVK